MTTESASNHSHVWIGAETGLIKSVDLINKTATNHFFEENYGKEQEVHVMCWKSKDKEVLFTGHKSGKIREFDVDNKTFTNVFDVPEFEKDKEKLVGLCRTADKFITCTTRGHLKIWDEEHYNSAVSCNTGPNTRSLAYNFEDNLLATGGEENCLKLWDACNPSQPIFKAKNVRNDWLQLRVPILVDKIKFIPESSKILTTTGVHNLRIYDPKSKAKRPVMETEFGKYPVISAAVSDTNRNLVFCGNTRGEAASFDIRKFNYELRLYKGYAGSIRDIVCHPTSPYFFSCGLDRHLYVHHENQTTAVHKVYLKSRLNCLLATDHSIMPEVKDLSKNRKRKLEDEIDDEVTNEMWEKMEKISDSSETDSDDSDVSD